MLAGLLLLSALPAASQRRRATPRPPAGPLRYGAEVRGESEGNSPLVCRPLYLVGEKTIGDQLLDHIAGDTLPLLEGYVAYRACRMNASANPPRPEGLGPWAVVEVARRHVNYPRFLYFDDARSTPAWHRNLVAYWGVFGRPGRLEAMVMDWQYRLIVARQSTKLAVPPGTDPLPAPRWVKPGGAGEEKPVEAQFEFAGQTHRLTISSRFLR